MYGFLQTHTKKPVTSLTVQKRAGKFKSIYVNPSRAPRERSYPKSAHLVIILRPRPFQELATSLVFEIGRKIQNEATKKPKKALNTLGAGASEKRPRSGLFSASK